VLTGPLEEERYRRATDAQGRLLVPNAELLALELLKDSAPDQERAPLERLKQRVLDYDEPAMSAPQRRFLLRELQRRFPDPAVAQMLAAEDLAARCVEAGPIHPGEPGLRPGALPGVWQFASGGGRVVTLHQTDALVAPDAKRISAQLGPVEESLTFLPPGKEFQRFFLSLPAGASMPGWRLALPLEDPRSFEAVAEQRIASYVWIGVLVFRYGDRPGRPGVAPGCAAQMALTQLRNDLVANVTHEFENTPVLDAPAGRYAAELAAAPRANRPRIPAAHTRRRTCVSAADLINFLTFSRHGTQQVCV